MLRERLARVSPSRRPPVPATGGAARADPRDRPGRRGDAAGDFFPLAENVAAGAGEATEALVRRLCAGLTAHTGARLDDDMALIVVRREAITA